MHAVRQLIALAILIPSLSTAQEPAGQRSGLSPGAARAISVVATVAPIAVGAQIQGVAGTLLGASAVLVGPSTGYWAGHAEGWQRGLVIRALAVTGAALLVASAQDCNLFNDDGDCATGVIGVVGGGVVIGASAIVDMVKVGGAVRDGNARAGRLSLVPPLGRSRGRWSVGFTQPF